jgi:hypothetical protein
VDWHCVADLSPALHIWFNKKQSMAQHELSKSMLGPLS